ncbi:hypothetical protein GCM10012285_35800 [Streptomyces kronopolitis]|uniref:G domain-containing protein n=1 Tax=Streptomyces kronopolitis TaxID=1612435 RepID=A0ABQ2JLT6_9ACTN|nr:hypothetical protein GCM10012285_35800 [Streptomyces kronopolitis]
MTVSEVTGSGEAAEHEREAGAGESGRKSAAVVGEVGEVLAEGTVASGERAGVVASEEHVGPVEPVEQAESAEAGGGAGAGGVWDDGLIARRARGGGVPRPGGRDGVSAARVESAVAAGVASSSGDRSVAAQGRAGVRAGGAVRGGEAGGGRVPVPSRADGSGYRWVPDGGRRAAGGGLRGRLDALRELIALSRSRLDGRTLEGAGRVLETADARYRLSGEHTVVALAGATGSGKSSLFNALAGANRSQVGPRRPTTAEPVACVWPGTRPGSEGLLDRLGVPMHRRHAPADGTSELSGLILIDLPDHDSSATEHRAQVDRMLELVDAVIWVVDPEKYADAVLHERYLRPLAGYAEVMFVVLNQVDRLPGDAADQVVDDLRRLLDEDGLALGEHGEPGAAVLALSAATGQGVGELREALGQFVAEQGAADRRLAADVDAAAERLRSVYVAQSPVGLTEQARAEFDDRLAEAVGAVATGRAAERDWLRQAERACGTPWARLRLRRGRGGRGSRWVKPASGVATTDVGAPRGATAGVGAPRRRGKPGGGRVGGGQTCGGCGETGTGAVRTGTGRAASGRTAPGRGVVRQGLTGQQGTAGGAGEPAVDGRAAARPVVEHAVRAVAGEAAHGLPAPWAQAVREAADRGAHGLPEVLDKAAAEAEESLRGGPAVKPRWWTVAASLQGLLAALQVVGVLWLVGVVTGLGDGTDWVSGLLPSVLGALGGLALTWLCRVVARGPARRYGQDAERRLRTAAAGCGRARVLEPVAAELLRYREVREQYAVASGV